MYGSLLARGKIVNKANVRKAPVVPAMLASPDGRLILGFHEIWRLAFRGQAPQSRSHTTRANNFIDPVP